MMLNGSETWPVKSDDVDRLKCMEMRMVRWMCAAPACSGPGAAGVSSEVLRERLGLNASVR